MKKKRGCFYLLFILLFVGGMHFSYASGNEEYNVSFQLDGQEYDINVKDLAEQNQISLEEYPYYMIGKNTYGDLSIYYGKGRITCHKYSNPDRYRLYNSDLVYRITIKEDGTTVQQVWDLSQSAIYMYKEEGYIGANHDIFCDGERIFVRNHGYVYDVSKESKEEGNEVVKIKSETKVYEYPAINYNELTTLPVGNSIKRIKKAVNEVNGHVWDKIVLSDGREGYVFSDSLEVTEEYSNIQFEYEEKMYNVYFNPSDLEVDIEEYPYYFIGKNTYGDLAVYYSKDRIIGRKYTNPERYRLNSSNVMMYRITIKADGTTVEQLWDCTKNASLMYKEEGYIGANHDIFCDGELIFARNHGYEYDINKESEEEVSEILKVNTETKVYEYPAINYNELSTLSAGNVVKRVKKEVNQINGHIWDKIVLSDGTEGYVFSDSIEIVEGYTNIEFEYKDKTYNVYSYPTDLGLNIEEYPYYLIGENTYGDLSVYYSKTRIICKQHSVTGNYRLYNGGELVYRLTIKGNGAIVEQLWDFNKNAIYMYKGTGYIGANHDIFCDGTPFFIRNHGYEYDISKENEEKVNEVVKANIETKVYEYPAINYNELTTLPVGNSIKRIKKAVNEVNGHVWDKIVLSDGREGYVFSDSLEVTEEYSNIQFEYEEKMYNVYFNPSDLEVDIEEYPYYFIGKNTYGDLAVYYSKDRIIGRKYTNPERYRLNSSNVMMYRITIKADGTTVEQLWDCTKNASLMYKEEGYIGANHDIFCDGELIFARNHGYEYDINKESEEEVSEIVKVNTETKVYEYPAINYNELATLVTGNSIKRIKKAVNEVNGHVWDKIVLSNGTEGYVYSDSIELASGYHNMEFKYEDKRYNVYFYPDNVDIDIKEYPYYIVGENTYGDLSIYYSKSKITCRRYKDLERYRLYNSEDLVYRITIKENGATIEQIWDLSQSAIYMDKEEGYIGANHDIYYEDTIIFNTCIYDEVGNLDYTTGSSWDNIKPDHSAYAVAKQGEEEYNSMTDSERIMIEPSLIVSKGIFLNRISSC